MNITEIKNFKNNTVKKIRSGRLTEAIADMRAFNAADANDWAIASAIDSIADNYTSMLRFMAAGAIDPDMPRMLADIERRARDIVDRQFRLANLPANPALYYSSYRTRSVRKGETIESLVSEYKAELERLRTDVVNIADARRTVRAEELLRALFDRVWTTHPLSATDAAAIRRFLDPVAEQVTPQHARLLIISALSLGLLEFFDDTRLFLLADAWGSGEPEVDARAITGIASALYRHRARPLSREAQNRIAALKDHPDWDRQFVRVAMEFIRAAEADEIADKMQNEVLPSLMKIDPELRKKLQSGDFDLDSLAEGMNPEWEDAMNKSGATEGLKELTEIQMDGGDVMMGSFRHMKRYEFFNHIANWFMPFYGEHSAVAGIALPSPAFMTLLERMPNLCDSDKFSMALTMDTLPESARTMTAQALEMNEAQVNNMLSEVEKVSTMTRTANAINKYVQNLYRFYSLFDRRREFFPLLAGRPDLTSVDALAANLTDEELLTATADFYLKHKVWKAAAALYSRIDSIAMPEARRFQQWGYALEQGGDLAGAITRYEEAELLDGESNWTLTRLASALRREGQAERAATYYKRLCDAEPDNPNLALIYGYTLTEAGRYDEARAQLHKAAYLMSDSLKPLRGLAWTQFLTGQYAEAVATYGKIIGAGAADDDWLNAGHAAWASGDVRNAINYYRTYAQLDSADPTRLKTALDADARYLDAAGLDARSRILMLEIINNPNL